MREGVRVARRSRKFLEPALSEILQKHGICKIRNVIQSPEEESEDVDEKVDEQGY